MHHQLHHPKAGSMKCFECGAEAHHQHHVVPKSMGGTQTVPLCASCHGKAHSIAIAGPELTKRALNKRKAEGQVYGPVPFGYQEKEGRLEAVETEAKLVAEIQSRRQAGETLQSIADTLNSQGIAGKQGGKWYPSSVKCILQRQAA